MKRGANVLVLLVIGLMLHGATRPIGAQWAQEALTQEEAAAALSFAEQFTRRMAVTRDVTPLLPEFFVPECAATPCSCAWRQKRTSSSIALDSSCSSHPTP